MKIAKVPDTIPLRVNRRQGNLQFEYQDPYFGYQPAICIKELSYLIDLPEDLYDYDWWFRYSRKKPRHNQAYEVLWDTDWNIKVKVGESWEWMSAYNFICRKVTKTIPTYMWLDYRKRRDTNSLYGNILTT